MEFGRENMVIIAAVLVTLFGLYGLAVGKIQFGPEGGSDVDDRELAGTRARVVSGLAVVAGISFLFSPTVGLCLTALVILLPWLLHK